MPAARASIGCSRARSSSSSGERRRRRRGGPRRRPAVDARRPRRRWVRLRDDVPAPAGARAPSRHRRDPARPGDDRRVGVVAGDPRAAKVHVHSERPDQVIAYGLRLGDAEPDQRREPRQRRRATSASAGRREFTGATAPDRGGRRRPGQPDEPGAVAEPTGCAVARRAPPSRSSPSPRATASRPSSDLRLRRGRSRRPGAPTRAPASCWRRSRRSTPTTSCSCRTTRTSSSPPARSPS